MTNNLINFPTIDSVNILGVEVDVLDVPTLHNQIDQFIHHDMRALIIHVNVYGLNLAYKRPWLQTFYNKADLCVCDGVGPILGARLLGKSLPERITYMDWIWPLCEFLSERNYSLFMLGGTPGVAEKAARKLTQQFPKLNVVGTQHGFFDKAKTSDENTAVIEKINKAKPDILMVGLGMPRQEKWLSENWGDLNANIGLGPGALFDYLSGKTSRAPSWMTNNGLEWFGRLLEEPQRMWQRYLLGNPQFILRVLKQRWENF